MSELNVQSEIRNPSCFNIIYVRSICKTTHMFRPVRHAAGDCRQSVLCYRRLNAADLSQYKAGYVSEMTYNVSSGTLNPTIPYHTIRLRVELALWAPLLRNIYHDFDRAPYNCGAFLGRPTDINLAASSVSGVVWSVVSRARREAVLDSKEMTERAGGRRCDSVMSIDEDGDESEGLGGAAIGLSQSFASGGLTELSSLYSMSEDVRTPNHPPRTHTHTHR